MYCLNIPQEENLPYEKRLDAERLLRSIGANGRYIGYTYLIYIVEMILASPESHHFLTKAVYPDTAKHFGVNMASVEHAMPESIWRRCPRTASLLIFLWPFCGTKTANSYRAKPVAIRLKRIGRMRFHRLATSP